MTGTAPTSAEGLVRALRKAGAPQRAASALVIGAPDLEETVTRLLKPTRLVAHHDYTFDPGDEDSRFQLVVAGEGLEIASLAGIRARLHALSKAAADNAYVGVWIATLSAPGLGAEDYHALLFPFSAAGGDLGPTALAATPLSASSWMLMVKACGFTVVTCEGFGQQPLPDHVESHAGRLSVYDPRELASGRLLMILRKTDDPR